MRTCRFARAGRVSYGALEGDQIRPFTAAPWAGGLASGQPIPLADVTLLAPVEPSKVVAVGKNYQAHALELGSEVPDQPLIFIKPSTAVIGPGERIVLPESSREVHHEAELAIVIGRTATRLSGPIPWATSRRAKPRTRRASSPYETSRPSATTAGAPGVRAAWARKA